MLWCVLHLRSGRLAASHRQPRVQRCGYVVVNHAQRRRRKSMEKAKIRPNATPKPLNRSSQKLASVIISLMAPGMQNVVTIGLGVSVPQIRDFAVPLDRF